MTTRARCPRCERALAACICAWARATPNEVELLLLQHPLEQHETKGTARLLQLSLAQVRLLRGERFEAAEVLAPGKTHLLLYPAPPAEPGEAAVPAEPLPPSEQLCLIVLDGTWRKSRKLLHLNPWLGKLPRLALQAPPATRYAAIRQAQRDGQMSTLEATVLALQQLEGRAERYAPLWQAFEGFVDQLGEHPLR